MAADRRDRRDPGRDHGDPRSARPSSSRALFAAPIRAGRRPSSPTRRHAGRAHRADRLRRPGRFRHAQPPTASRPAASRSARIRRVPARPRAAPSSPTAPTATATSSSTSANSASAGCDADQLDPGAVRGLPVLPCHGLVAVRRRRSRGGARGRRAGPGGGAKISFDPNIRKELLALPEVRGDDRGHPGECRPAAAERGRSRSSLSRARARTQAAGAARRRPAHGGAEEGAGGQRAAQARQAPDRAAGLPGRGGRSDRCRRLLRRDIRRLPRARRAGRAGAAPAPTPPAPWPCASRGRWRAIPTMAELEAFLQSTARLGMTASAAAPMAVAARNRAGPHGIMLGLLRPSAGARGGIDAGAGRRRAGC